MCKLLHHELDNSNKNQNQKKIVETQFLLNKILNDEIKGVV
jgi:hypothetical protein